MIGYISHGEWADAELEYKGKLFNENNVTKNKVKEVVSFFKKQIMLYGKL